ncbi:hypothetical protein T492DRAFT_1105786 [Pavlovales sp. CCMP2436]|nr:hypothetical protein T492DRAFT_1105786 [Pavlovales sp. CCMP2436]
MEMMDEMDEDSSDGGDDGDDADSEEAGKQPRRRVPISRRAGEEDDESEENDSSSEPDKLEGVEEGSEEEESEDEDDSGSEPGEESVGSGGHDWRASLANVAFEDIEKLRRDGARIQPLAKRAADGGKGATQRSSKNAPSEVTSKKPVGRLRLAHGFNAGSLKDASTRAVDPRFEKLAGGLDEAAVRQRYGFVYEMAADEAKQLKSRLKQHRAADGKTGDKRRQAKRAGKLLDANSALELQRDADRRVSLLSSKARSDRERAARSELKAKELKLVAAGKMPFFAKRSVLKEATLTKQYEELKSSGKLSGALAERRKRRASKQRKWMPTARNEREES